MSLVTYMKRALKIVPGSHKTLYNSYLQPFSSRGTQKLITKILQHTPNIYIFAILTKNNRYNFDPFTLDGYGCVGCCHFLI